MNSKKEQEKWVLDLFIANYEKGKIDLISIQECPDFIVTYNGKRVGVELTEVFQDSHLRKSKMKQESSEGSQFTEDLIKLIQPCIPFKFSIGIHFNKYYPVKKSNKFKILRELERICVTEMVNLENHGHLELENYTHNLPDEIEDIYIYRFDDMLESFDSRPEGGIVSTLTIEYLKKILTNKELKLSKYDACDQQWLLIREGNYYSGSFSDIEVEIPIDTRFDKVFLVRTKTSDIVELK